MHIRAPDDFRCPALFYETLFHELVHATGHERRLNRSSLYSYEGVRAAAEYRKMYCLEELIAELGAGFLSVQAGLHLPKNENEHRNARAWRTYLELGQNYRWVLDAAVEAE